MIFNSSFKAFGVSVKKNRCLLWLVKSLRITRKKRSKKDFVRLKKLVLDGILSERRCKSDKVYRVMSVLFVQKSIYACREGYMLVRK